MPLVSVEYSVRQPIRRAAPEAYAWCTTFTDEDMAASGRAGGRRVVRVCNDTFILEDTNPGPSGAMVRRDKLVRCFPSILAWSNTHLSGPNTHSQLLYRLLPDGPGACIAELHGQLVLDHPTGAPADLQALAEKQAHDVGAIWKTLASLCEAAAPA